MIKSIQQFQTKGVENLEKIFMNYSDDLTKVAEMIHGVTTSVIELGCSMIAEEWEFYDRERSYLLDSMMGFAPKERLTEDAVARILDEAADSSYRKGGINVSISEHTVSKETVMDKIHPLKFPKLEASGEKRNVETLYIDADEDHVALQYLEKKGDIKKPRCNTFMPKLVYVYEGVNAENDRHELENLKCFGGGYQGTKGVEALWKEVYDYIAQSYDEDCLRHIYVNGDGAEWIQTGAKYHGKAKFVLDRFHMHKYIIGATSHLMDSACDARSELWRAINGRHKEQAEKTFDRIIRVTATESKIKAVEASKNYIMGHWRAIMNGIK